VPPTEPIRPLHDVWLRPRRVFRELASVPIGASDYLLGAAQGIANWLALSRARNDGAASTVTDIFGKALVLGSIGGVASLLLLGTVYERLCSRAGTAAARNQVFHVLAYGGVPLAASLAVWLVTALLVGEATFEQVPGPDVEGFVAVVLRLQIISYVLLWLWSVVIQVMGLSEIQGLVMRKALGLWILGQLIGSLALLFLMILIATLFPSAVTG
jgi:hypothetical protein